MIRFKEHYSLQQYNTFGIDAKARYFFEFTELEDLMVFQDSNSSFKDLPVLLLGGGSNLLFVNDFNGVVIHSNVPGIKQVNEDRNHVWLEVGAGEDWDAFVDYCVRNDFYGLENLSLIPGNVGAAPVQNIGAYGVEVQDYIDTVKGYDLQTQTEYDVSASECKFAYRNSIFKNELKNRFVVCSVVFRLDKFPEFKLNYGHLKSEVEKYGEVTAQNVRKAVIQIRESKLPDPEEFGNAGSFFKNPVVSNEEAEALKSKHELIPLYPSGDGLTKVAAGWLIEQSGWKGFREGDAGVHEKQALVLVNYGNATGQEIFQLSEKIKQSVFEKFGIELEREVNVI
ncbi:UDP-N-acetylmuramate dehydrogenase [Sunxiuqinia sp. A32]|uniref:UDP-N-acetylmuramate dehydrogenase n=1 Tax=Sunxiuqinia sp. A32 TaxID=3461496 RepID=UPI0040466BDB